MPTGMSTLEIADNWFLVESVGDGVSLITEPEVDPFIRCNMWLVRGRDRSLLIDTGLGVRSLRAELPLLAERPVVCLATHAHFDHCGGLHEFDERLGHALEAEIYAAPSNEATVADRYIGLQSFVRLPSAGYEPLRYSITPAPLTRRVDEGDVIDLGDRALKVVHLPGHTQGHVGLWEEKTGLLFSGDALYDGLLLDHFYARAREDYVETMARLRELPVRIVHGGHCASFGRARMFELIEDYLAGRRCSGCPRTQPGAGRSKD
jgi:glyoxylase-like metal-dependent hydrolase (beta-lactamase superfamily II)